LKDLEAIPFTVPAGVPQDGRLVVVVRKATEPEEEIPPSGGAEERWGPACFWFRPVEDGNLVPVEGLLVVKRLTSFHGNFLLAGLLAGALLFLAGGMATLAGALFSQAVAFAFCLTIFLCGLSMPFLRESVETLSFQSALNLLSDPAELVLQKKPTWFDRGLEHFLNFWITVLPDFSSYRGGEYLFSGKAIRWITVLRAHALGIGYALGFLLLALLGLRRWEVNR
jgi:hypothetical protein